MKNPPSSPLTKALKFNGANQYGSVANFNPTKEKGYCIILTVANISTKSVQTDLSKRGAGNSVLAFNARDTNGDGTLELLLQSRSTNDPSTQSVTQSLPIDYLKIHSFILNLHPNRKVDWYVDGRLIRSGFNDWQPVGYDELSNDFTIGGSSFDLTSTTYFSQKEYLQVGIAKGIATPSQIIQLWNNGLLANPKKSWNNLEWQLYPNWNQILDDGAGNYSLQDSSPQNHTIDLSGFDATTNFENTLPLNFLKQTAILDNQSLSLKSEIYVKNGPQAYAQAPVFDTRQGVPIVDINNRTLDIIYKTPPLGTYSVETAEQLWTQVYAGGGGYYIRCRYHAADNEYSIQVHWSNTAGTGGGRGFGSSYRITGEEEVRIMYAIDNRDGGEHRLFVNGVLDTISIGAGSAVNLPIRQLGGTSASTLESQVGGIITARDDNEPTVTFGGKLVKVAIINQFMDVAGEATHRTYRYGSAAGELLLEYRFNTPNSNTIFDYSPYRNHAQLINADASYFQSLNP